MSKVSVNSLDKAYKSIENESVVTMDSGEQVKIKKVIGLKDAVEVAANIVACCYDEDGEYLPVVRDFVTKKFIIEAYTNITLPSNADKCFSYVYGMELSKLVGEYASISQIDMIINSVDETINLRNARDTSEVFSEVREITKIYQDISDRYNEVMVMLSDAFGDVDWKEFIAKFSNIGESQIIDRVVDTVIPDVGATKNTPVTVLDNKFKETVIV